MSGRKIMGALGAIAVAAVGLIVLRGLSSRTPPVSERTTHEFGEVVQGQVVEHAFGVRNDGSQPLHISTVMPNAARVTVEDSVIPPGGTANVTARLATDRMRGPVAEVIRLEFSGQERPRWLQLRGRVVLPIQLSPQDRAYFFTVRGEPSRQEIVVINHRDRPLNLLSLSSDSPLFRVQADTLESGRRYRLTITLDPETPVGRHAGAITLQTDSPEYPMVTVLSRAFVKDIVSASLTRIEFSRLDFEGLSRRAVAQRTVLVEKYRGTDFAVLRATADVPFLAVEIETRKPGQSFLVHVRIVQEQAPRAPFTGTLRIQTNDPDFAELTLPISGEIL